MVQTVTDSTLHQNSGIQAYQDLLYKINELLKACVNFDPSGMCKIHGEVTLVSELPELVELLPNKSVHRKPLPPAPSTDPEPGAPEGSIILHDDEMKNFRHHATAKATGATLGEAYLQSQSYERDLMFLKMMMWSFGTWGDIDGVIWDHTFENLRQILDDLEGIREYMGEVIDGIIPLTPIFGKRDWDLFSLLLKDTIRQCKSLIVEYCHGLLDSLLECNFLLPIDKTIRFLQDVLHSLEVLVLYKAAAISPVKMQIDSLKLRLKLSRDFFRLIAAHASVDVEELRDLEVYVHSLANNAACVAFLFWANSGDEEIYIEAKINKLFSDMGQEIVSPCGVTLLYLGALLAIQLQPSDDSLLHGQVISGFVSLHLENPMDDSRNARDWLVFLLTFMTNPPARCDEDEQLEMLYNEVDVLFRKCTSLILKQGFTIEEALLSDFSEKLEETMRKVKHLYVKVPDSLSYNFPRTNGLGFYQLLLQNLETLKEQLNSDTAFIPYAKNSIIKIKEELVSLKPVVLVVFELQKEQKEFRDTWSQIINLAYRTEHVINSCSVCIHPVWYNMASLFDIVDQIQQVKRNLEKADVKKELENVGNCEMHRTKNLLRPLQSSGTTSGRILSSITIGEEAIGLEEETRQIIDELIGGHESLHIISIIGMGGLGKSTLAKEVCNSKLVRSHFHKLAFCGVSQVLNKRHFLIDVLCGIDNLKKEEFDSMTEDDLAHHLWRCLSGQKYLIVVDDIWDIKAWDAIKSSFPDDRNKSRVIFTTRELKLALDAKSGIYELKPRSDSESLKLLHKKVFGEENCPPHFYEFGNMILKSCRGLPLAIVVVAGLLVGNKTSSTWWEEIAETTSRFVGRECMDIIGLSYKHLPEHLKACFLYMGIYREDELIRAKRLRQLWIGEGFVNESMTKGLRIAGKEYLRDLVERNLVTSVERSCRGEIRTCLLHDLIGDFCRRQAEEDNFLWLGDRLATSNCANPTKRNLYRISVQTSLAGILPAIVENIHSLLWRSPSSLTKFVWEKLKLVQVLHLVEGNTDSIFSSHLVKSDEPVKIIDDVDEWTTISIILLSSSGPWEKQCWNGEILDHLVHLRYISIRWWDGKVPESVCNLCSLETFIIEDSGSVLELPKTIWKMERLRHLEFGGGCKFVLEDTENEGRHRFLDNVQYLSKLWLYDDRTARVILLRLPNIQKLTCVLVGAKQNSKDFTFGFLKKLESLTLQSTKTVNSILAFRFPSTLKRVDFRAKITWTQQTLSACGKLPCLEVLKVEGPMKQWDVEDDQFHKLKYLKMDLYYLEQWNVSFDSFSCLEQLDLSHCKHLKEIPACFTELPTLHRIRSVLCNKELERSAIYVQKEQRDNGNVIQIEIKK